ncbi:hypothetical protein K438DRAFT_1980053 [Mycena galopus ATCC 62051]|nr:hypothetical protein K438DRAFT_1980053 [Mycena galopus ATCC 62051]
MTKIDPSLSILTQFPQSMGHGASSLPDLPEDPYNRNAMDACIANIRQRYKEAAAEIHDEERESGMKVKRLGKVEKAVVVNLYPRAGPAMDERHAAIKGEMMRNEIGILFRLIIPSTSWEFGFLISFNSLTQDGTDVYLRVSRFSSGLDLSTCTVYSWLQLISLERHR